MRSVKLTSSYAPYHQRGSFGAGFCNASSDTVKIPVPVDKTLNSLFDRRLRLKADIGYQRVDVSKRARHVAGLQRQHVLDGLLAHRLLNAFDKIHQFDRLVVADVVE